MAEICVDSTLSRIGTVSEIIEQMDPHSIGEHILETLTPRVDELVDEIMLARHPTLWKNLPKQVKRLAYERVALELPQTIESLVDEISPKIETLFDLKEMIVEHLEKDKQLTQPTVLGMRRTRVSLYYKKRLVVWLFIRSFTTWALVFIPESVDASRLWIPRRVGDQLGRAQYDLPPC